MKLIIAEQGNNAWLAHGTPHLNVRNDYVDTATVIKRKNTFGAVNMWKYNLLTPTPTPLYSIYLFITQSANLYIIVVLSRYVLILF